jgi:hypothetical protein
MKGMLVWVSESKSKAKEPVRARSAAQLQVESSGCNGCCMLTQAGTLLMVVGNVRAVPSHSYLCPVLRQC